MSGESAEKVTISQSQNQEKWASQNIPQKEEVRCGEEIEACEGSFEGEAACEGVRGEAGVKYGTICVPQTRKSDLSIEQEQEEEEERVRGGQNACWRRFQDDVQAEVGKLKEVGFLGLVSQEEKEEGEEKKGIVLLSQEAKPKSRVQQSQQGALGEHRWTQSYFVLN